MTRASIITQIEKIVAEVAVARDINQAIEAKGGELEAANALVYLALRDLSDDIVASTNPPATQLAITDAA